MSSTTNNFLKIRKFIAQRVISHQGHLKDNDDITWAPDHPHKGQKPGVQK
jgi:hypothetical protein